MASVAIVVIIMQTLVMQIFITVLREINGLEEVIMLTWYTMDNNCDE